MIGAIGNSFVKSSFHRHLITSAFWSLTGAIFARCGAVLTAIFIARMLSVEDFGKLAIITSTTTMLATFASMGLSVTCTRYVAQLRYKDIVRARSIVRLALLAGLVSGSIITLIAYFSAPFLASELLNIPELTTELRIAFFILLTDTLLGVHTGTLAGLESFRQITRISIIQGGLALLLTLGGVRFYGITGAVVATAASSIIGLILSSRMTGILLLGRNSFSYDPSVMAELRILWGLSLPVTLAGIVVTPAIWFGNMVLARSSGGYGEVGVFNAANQWRILLVFLPSVLSNVILPLISTPEHESNSKLSAVNFLSGWILVSFPALIIISFPELTGMVLGSKYNTNAYRYSLVILMLVVCVTAYKEGIVRRMITDDLLWWGVVSNLLWGGMLAGLLFWRPVTSSHDLVNYYLFCYGASTIIFVPLYMKKQIMPSVLLFSKEALFIWIILFLGVYCHFQQTVLAIRIAIFPLLVFVMAWSFAGLWQKLAHLRAATDQESISQ